MNGSDMNLKLFLLLLALPAGLTAQEKIPDTVKKAQAKLDLDPSDQDANLTLGKYLLGISKVEDALDHLAKGSDPALRALALKDVSKPDDPALLGGEWIDASKKNAALRQAMMERAVYWYGQAWFKADDKEKTKLRPILAKLASPPPGYEKPDKKTEQVPGWDYSEVTVAFTEGGFAHSGRRSIKILPMGKLRTDFAYADTAMMPVVPKKKLSVSAWVFSDRTDVDGRLEVRIYDMGGKVIESKSFMIPQDCPFWLKVGGELEVPETGFRAMLHIETKTTMGGMWIDDASIVSGGKEVMKNGAVEERR